MAAGPVGDEPPDAPDKGALPPPGVGPRRKRAPMWAKLWTLVVTTNLGGFAVALWTSRLVRGGRVAPGTESWWLAAYYGAMLVVAAVEALLVDELVFGGAFRKTHIEGKSPRFVRRDDDVDEVATVLQRSSVSFPFTLLLCLGLTYLVFNAVNGDFDAYYRRVGKYASILRTKAPARRDERIEAIAALSIRREPQVLPILLSQLGRGGPEAPYAAWALGRFGDLPRPSRLFPPLLAAARRGDRTLSREAYVALGRLQHRAVAPNLVALAEADLERDGRVDPRVLYGLGAVQVTASLPLLARVLHEGDVRSQRLAAWALAQHRDQVGGRKAVEILHQRILSAELPVRCAIVHALGILSDERSNTVLMKAYDATSAPDRVQICRHEEISMRPDGKKDDVIVVLMPSEAFGFKVIRSMAQMRATTPQVRAEVEPWLAARASDPSATPAVRQAAESLRKGIREGRDDSRWKSAADLFE